MWNNLGACAARRPCTALSPNATNRLLRARAGSLRIMRCLSADSNKASPASSELAGEAYYKGREKTAIYGREVRHIRALSDEKGQYSLYIRSTRYRQGEVGSPRTRSLDHFGLFLPLGRRVFLLTAEEEEEKHADQQGIAGENKPYTRPISHLEAVFVLSEAVDHRLRTKGADRSPDAVGH